MPRCVTLLPLAGVLFGNLLLSACATSPSADPAYPRYMRLGDDLASRGDPVSAGSLYEKAAQLPGAGVEPWLKLGQARLDAGDLAGAERAYQQALHSAPHSPEALLGLGGAQVRQGRFERAVTALEEAARLSGHARAYSSLGIAQVLRGDTGAAQMAFAKARSLAPDDLDIQCNQALGLALGRQGEVALSTMGAVLRSPRVQARHQRNALLIAVLAGREDVLSGLALDELPAPQRAALLQQARQVKALDGPVAQARAMGLVAAQ
jgi:Flp pilus assembly protein TadD